MSNTSDIDKIINKKLKKKIDKFAEDAFSYCKEKVADEIEIHYEDYIAEFYEHYPHPKSYDRSLSTYKASDVFNDSSAAYAKGEHIVGIYVSAENIPGNPYYIPHRYGMRKSGEPVDKDWVFNNTFIEGRHGVDPYIGWGPMDVKPYESMKTWFDAFRSNKGRMQDKIKEKAFQKAFAKNFKKKKRK